MKNPTKKGQKFTAYGENYTVKGFAGSTGIEYPTLNEAKKNNPNDNWIGIINTEYGGMSKNTESFLV